MPYSIGNSPLEVIRGDTNGALGALGNAYQMMSKGMDKLSEAPNNAYNWLQDTADARYNEALNRYANDPEGLATALQNGSINTANVRATTLGQTQDKLKDIAMNRYLNYSYNQTKKSDDWFNGNQDLIGRFVSASQQGDTATAEKIRAEAAANGIDTTNFTKYLMLNPLEQKNKETEFALQRQRIAQEGSANALQWAKYNDALAERQLLGDITSELAHLGYGDGVTLNPAQLAEVTRLSEEQAKNYRGNDYSKLRKFLIEYRSRNGNLPGLLETVRTWGSSALPKGSGDFFTNMGNGSVTNQPTDYSNTDFLNWQNPNQGGK